MSYEKIITGISPKDVCELYCGFKPKKKDSQSKNEENSKQKLREEAVKNQLLQDAKFDQMTEIERLLAMVQRYALACDMITVGITLNDARQLYDDSQFDYSALKIEFKKICCDFGEEITWGSLSLRFACMVLYKFAPESRRLKRTNGDRCWRLRFPKKQSNELNTRVVFISSCRFHQPPPGPPTATNGMLVLTIEQASLLATDTLAKMIKLAVSQNMIFLTPLAGAIFNKEDIKKIALSVFGDSSGASITKTVATVISSCQRGGHHLELSDVSVAVCAAIAATKNLTDVQIKNSIVAKTYKEYINAKKIFDLETYRKYSAFATGGIPAEFDPNKLCKKKPKRLNLQQLLKSLSLLSVNLTGAIDPNQPSGSDGGQDDLAQALPLGPIDKNEDVDINIKPSLSSDSK